MTLNSVYIQTVFTHNVYSTVIAGIFFHFKITSFKGLCKHIRLHTLIITFFLISLGRTLCHMVTSLMHLQFSQGFKYQVTATTSKLFWLSFQSLDELFLFFSIFFIFLASVFFSLLTLLVRFLNSLLTTSRFSILNYLFSLFKS